MEFEKLNTNSQMPKSRIMPLFLDDLKISNTAKVLYCRLLDVARKHHRDAFDKNISLAIEYRIWEMARDLNCSQSTIKRALNTLEHEGLIKRIRKVSGKPNDIYVNFPDDLPKSEHKNETPTEHMAKTEKLLREALGKDTISTRSNHFDESEVNAND